VDPAGHQILHSLAGDAIMHELKTGARGNLKENTEDVLRAADASGPYQSIVWISLQPGNEALQVVRRDGIRPYN
jgi:hypothetical protein